MDLDKLPSRSTISPNCDGSLQFALSSIALEIPRRSRFDSFIPYSAIGARSSHHIAFWLSPPLSHDMYPNSNKIPDSAMTRASIEAPVHAPLYSTVADLIPARTAPTLNFWHSDQAANPRIRRQPRRPTRNGPWSCTALCRAFDTMLSLYLWIELLPGCLLKPGLVLSFQAPMSPSLFTLFLQGFMLIV
jgi:hypothetical protein